MTDASALWTTDIAEHRAESPVTDLLKSAASAARKHPFALVADFLKVTRGPGKLTFDEYVNYRLYDRALYPDDKARLRFLSEKRHWPLCYQCSDKAWDATTEDKWIAEVLLREAGLRATETVAVVGGGPRNYGRAPHLRDADAFAAFMAERSAPLFAKVNGGLGSEGATRIVPLGDGRFEVARLGTVDAATLFTNLNGAPAPYLLQEELVHHPRMTELAGERIATIRAISFVVDGAVHTPIAVLKMTAGGNIADNYWRSGNLVADLDESTGEIRRAVRGMGPDLETVTHHPDTGAALVGARLPLWPEVRALTRAVGELYAPVKYQSLDIAITADGPAVVEVNTGSSFMLSQVAKGEGFLTDEVIDLFRRAGATLDTKKLDAAA